jgi:hypothetical protein
MVLPQDPCGLRDRYGRAVNLRVLSRLAVLRARRIRHEGAGVHDDLGYAARQSGEAGNGRVAEVLAHG